MKWGGKQIMNRILFFLTCMTFLLCASYALAAENGVYVKIVENAKGGFDEISGKVEKALTAAGWNVLAAYDTGVPEDCACRSRVIVFTSASYAKTLMSFGVHAAFAVPLRVGIQADRNGTNIVLLNAASMNQIVVGQEELEGSTAKIMASISDAIAKAVPGRKVYQQLGTIRNTQTVQGMWGGEFVDQIVPLYASRRDSDANLRKLAKQVKNGILGNEAGWKLVYELDLSSQGAILFGVAEKKMEAAAFDVAGEKGSRMSEPVLDHNTAFPIEVIVYREKGKVKVVTLYEMYRMKLYFQDAGTWLFIKHMRMPSQIQEEIVEMSIGGIIQQFEN